MECAKRIVADRHWDTRDSAVTPAPSTQRIRYGRIVEAVAHRLDYYAALDPQEIVQCKQALLWSIGGEERGPRIKRETPCWTKDMNMRVT